MTHFEGDGPKPGRELALEGLPDRFDAAVSWGADKPDFKELDLGSPVSPLRTQPPSKSACSSSSSSGSGSVSGKAGSANAVVRRSEGHSGELSGSSEGSPTAPGSNRPRPGHTRSNSGPLIYSGGSSGGGGSGGGSSSSASSPITANLLPSGNICRSGRIGKPMAAACRSSHRSDVLGSGTGNYGHGNVMRGRPGGETSAPPSAAGNIQTAGVAVMARRAIASGDPEEVRRVGNEQYKRGNFAEALGLYDRAIAMSPDNAACRSNRAAALIGLGRLAEAVSECEEALRLDPTFGRAHQRLASLHLRLGQVENARRHLFSTQFPDSIELQKLQVVEKHLSRCVNARKTGDWKSALREGDAAIAAGADSSPQLFALRAEALLKLHQLVEADSALSNIPRYEISSPSCAQAKFCGMLCDSYPFFVRAQVEMALGRFENAVASAEKAGQYDPRNIEIATIINNVRSVARARVRGNDLFNASKFHDACLAYGEGLKFDPCNPVLFCNRAACRYKLGQWERAVDDCNEALRIQPNYTKALLRRAACNDKLERWAESVRDYEILRKELPSDKEMAEALFHAQVALMKFRGEEVYNMKFGGEVEEISGLDPFRAAVSSPGVFVVYFTVASNIQCQQISPFVDELCIKYPSLNFLKVNVDKSPTLANAENVRIVPTFKIYKNGARVKEMICPSQQVLEYSVRHYSL